MQETLPLHLEVGRKNGKVECRPYLDCLLNMFGLSVIINDKTTMEPVRVAVTFDGGSISRFLGHVTGGFKLVDSRSKHPKSKDPLFGDSGHEKLQPHIHCFPIKMALAKDSKDLHFTELWIFLILKRI